MSKSDKSDKKKKDDEELEDHDHDASDKEEDESDEDEGSEDEKEGADEDASDEEDADDESADDEEEDDDEGSSDEDEEAAAAGADHDADDDAPPAGDASSFAAKYGAKTTETAGPKSRPRRPRADAPKDNHDDVAPSYPDDEDPSWWAPHAVLGTLVLFGMLGFFGVFNKALAFMRPPNMKAETTMTETAAAPPESQPKQPTPTRAPPAPGDPAQQPPREMFGAKHLLVMYAGSRRAPPDIKRTKDEAKARAVEAMKKAKDGKTKFEDVVKEYTDEPGGGQRGGDLGSFPKGAMVPEFQAGLDKLKVGEISDVVETPFGFHVILRTK